MGGSLGQARGRRQSGGPGPDSFPQSSRPSLHCNTLNGCKAHLKRCMSAPAAQAQPRDLGCHCPRSTQNTPSACAQVWPSRVLALLLMALAVHLWHARVARGTLEPAGPHGWQQQQQRRPGMAPPVGEPPAMVEDIPADPEGESCDPDYDSFWVILPNASCNVMQFVDTSQSQHNRRVSRLLDSSCSSVLMWVGPAVSILTWVGPAGAAPRAWPG